MATRKKLTTVEIARANVLQLQNESKIPKMKVSAAVNELQAYIEAHQNDDYLVRGFESSPKKNPFRKKKLNSCTIC